MPYACGSPPAESFCNSHSPTTARVTSSLERVNPKSNSEFPFRRVAQKTARATPLPFPCLGANSPLAAQLSLLSTHNVIREMRAVRSVMQSSATRILAGVLATSICVGAAFGVDCRPRRRPQVARRDSPGAGGYDGRKPAALIQKHAHSADNSRCGDKAAAFGRINVVGPNGHYYSRIKIRWRPGPASAGNRVGKGPFAIRGSFMAGNAEVDVRGEVASRPGRLRASATESEKLWPRPHHRLVDRTAACSFAG